MKLLQLPTSALSNDNSIAFRCSNAIRSLTALFELRFGMQHEEFPVGGAIEVSCCAANQ
jgi:hypothetical protein